MCFCITFVEFYFSAFLHVIVKVYHEAIKACECGGRDPRICNFGPIWRLGLSLTLRPAALLPSKRPSVYY